MRYTGRCKWRHFDSGGTAPPVSLGVRQHMRSWYSVETRPSLGLL
jgi:hypothetical protein